MVLCEQQPMSDTVTVVIIWGWDGLVVSHLALRVKVEMSPFSRKVNVGFGEARSKIANTASCLL